MTGTTPRLSRLKVSGCVPDCLYCHRAVHLRGLLYDINVFPEMSNTSPGVVRSGHMCSTIAMKTTWNAVNAFISYIFCFSTLSPTHRKYSMLGLFKGLEAKLLQTVLTAALMFRLYEKIASSTFRVM